MPLCFETAKLFDKVIMHVCTYYKHGKTKYITFIGLEFFMPKNYHQIFVLIWSIEAFKYTHTYT